MLVGPIDLGLAGVSRAPSAERLHVPGVTSSLSATEESILWEIRMPRVVLAALVGGMLSLAGATYQGVFRNPLVDPYLLGVAAGAGLGATLVIAYLPEGLRGQQALPAAAFVGGAVAVFLTYSVGRSTGRGRDATTLVLAGVTVASFFTALQTFVQQQNADTLQQVYTWILGSIPSSGWSDVVLVLPYVAIATVVILVYRRVVDVLSLGDEEATSLGVDVRRVRLVLVVAATIGTAAAVAVCGLIGFVGIIVPHAIRMLARRRLPRAAPALVHRRRGLPRARGRHRPNCALARRRSRSGSSPRSSARPSSRSCCARAEEGRRERGRARRASPSSSEGVRSSTGSISRWRRANGWR